MVGGESGEVDLAVMGNCHASIIGGGYHEELTLRLGLGLAKAFLIYVCFIHICSFFV